MLLENHLPLMSTNIVNENGSTKQNCGTRPNTPSDQLRTASATPTKELCLIFYEAFSCVSVFFLCARLGYMLRTLYQTLSFVLLAPYLVRSYLWTSISPQHPGPDLAPCTERRARWHNVSVIVDNIQYILFCSSCKQYFQMSRTRTNLIVSFTKLNLNW